MLWPVTIEVIKKLPRLTDRLFITVATKQPHNANTINKYFRALRYEAKVKDEVKIRDIRDGAYTAACEAQGVQYEHGRILAAGETAGTFLCHGTPVGTDELVDVYSRRDFSKVSAALADVRKLLEPMFRGGHGVFAGPRSKGSANISRGNIDRILELHLASLRPEEIARRTGVSRATAYRRASQLKQGIVSSVPAMSTRHCPRSSDAAAPARGFKPCPTTQERDVPRKDSGACVVSRQSI